MTSPQSEDPFHPKHQHPRAHRGRQTHTLTVEAHFVAIDLFYCFPLIAILLFICPQRQTAERAVRAMTTECPIVAWSLLTLTKKLFPELSCDPSPRKCQVLDWDSTAISASSSCPSTLLTLKRTLSQISSISPIAIPYEKSLSTM
jgi:hypothetical protein